MKLKKAPLSFLSFGGFCEIYCNYFLQVEWCVLTSTAKFTRAADLRLAIVLEGHEAPNRQSTTLLTLTCHSPSVEGNGVTCRGRIEPFHVSLQG